MLFSFILDFQFTRFQAANSHDKKSTGVDQEIYCRHETKNNIPARKNFCHGENNPPVASLGTAVQAVVAVEIKKSR